MNFPVWASFGFVFLAISVVIIFYLAVSLLLMWETWVQSLGWEDLLEKEMATHSSLPAWRIPWTEELGGLQSMGSQRVRQDSATKQGFLMIRFRLFIVFFSAHTSRQDADLLTSWLC